MISDMENALEYENIMMNVTHGCCYLKMEIGLI